MRVFLVASLVGGIIAAAVQPWLYARDRRSAGAGDL
jgi:hypothetical protein